MDMRWLHLVRYLRCAREDTIKSGNPQAAGCVASVLRGSMIANSITSVCRDSIADGSVQKAKAETPTR